MITQEALNAAIPLATVLDNRNLYLTAISNSPLEALVNATRTVPMDSNVVVEYTTDVETIVSLTNAKDNVLGHNAHDLAMDDIVEVASEAVRGHMIFAKTVVAAAVDELVSKVNAALTTITPSTLIGMEVVVWNPPKPMLNSALEDAIKKFNETTFSVVDLKMKCPLIPASEIIELMKSGSGVLDTAISEWAAEKGDAFFDEVWQNVFQMKQAELNSSAADTLNNWVYRATDYALAIFLIARKLLNSPLPDTEMELSSFNNLVAEYRNQAAYKLCMEYDAIDTIVKNDVLVRLISGSVTTVNGIVYDKFIAAGGSNEVLFGNALNKVPSVSMSVIQAASSELQLIWDRHSILISTVERNKRFVRTKELLMKEFNNQMRALSEDVVGSLENRVNIVKAFEVELNNVREDELNDLYAVCLNLLCASRFIKTEAKRILMGIERVKKENPHIEIREAAAISMIEYIAWWLGTQFKVNAK